MHSFVITYDIPEHCLPTYKADLLNVTAKNEIEYKISSD